MTFFFFMMSGGTPPVSLDEISQRRESFVPQDVCDACVWSLLC